MTKKKMSPEQEEKLAGLILRGFGAFSFSFFASLVIAQGDWGEFFIAISIMTVSLFGLSLMVNFQKVAEGFKALMAEHGNVQGKNHAHEIGKKQTAFMCDTVNNPAFHSMSGNIYHRNY